jgi:hypothetical protein
MSDAVGLTLPNDETIYVNPARVTYLVSDSGARSKQTSICFDRENRITVKGDVDTIAFMLFPAGAR